jgi:hypothetical protein
LAAATDGFLAGLSAAKTGGAASNARMADSNVASVRDIRLLLSANEGRYVLSAVFRAADAR